MCREVYDEYPDTLTVREVDADGRVLVTTMLNRRRAPKNALADLYTQRWHIELDLRNIKTTLGMEVLRCKTPDMVEKELWVNLLAYNLIRLLMAQAALASGLLPRELSQEEDELTPTLKVKRRVIEQRYAELIDSIYRD